MIGLTISPLVFMPKFSFDPNSQVILVKALIRGPCRTHAINMILDTGATYTLIAPEILMDVGLDPSKSQKTSRITTASGLEYVSFIPVPCIEALGMQKENLEVCVHSLPTPIPARGLLGLNFLRDFEIRLNLSKGILEIQTSSG